MDLSQFRDLDQLPDADLFEYEQMSNEEIKSARRSGDLVEAYRGAMVKYQTDPTEYTQGPLCFVLLDCMKALESKETFAEWRFFLDKVLELEFDLSADRFARIPFDRTIRNTSRAVGIETFNKTLQNEGLEYPWFGKFVNKVENSLSPKEVFDLFKAGNLNQAYAAAVQNYADDPGNEFVRNTLSSIYLRYLELSMNDPALVKKCLDKILEMNFNLMMDKYLGNSFKSKLRKAIQSMGEEQFDREMADEMKKYSWFKNEVSEVKDNAKSYLVSELWKAFKDNRMSMDEIITKLSAFKDYQNEFLSPLIWTLTKNANDQQVLKIVHNLGWNCYRKADYLPSSFEDKQTGEEKHGKPLIMKEFIAYRDVLLKLPRSVENDQLIKEFINEINSIIQKAGNNDAYEYIYYYKAKLENKIGDDQGATKSMLKFLDDNPKHFGDYWCWEKLGEFAQLPDDKITLFCKTLLCKTKPENLIRTHGKLIELFQAKQKFDLASAEINATNELNQIKNNAQIANYLSQCRQNSWYDANAQPDKKEYQKYAQAAEKYVYGDIPEVTIYVNNLNRDKRMVNCVFTNGNTGFFRCPDDVDIHKLQPDAFYNAQLIVDDTKYTSHTSVAFPTDAHYKCIQITDAKDPREEHIVSARLTKRAGADFAFTTTNQFVGKRFIDQYDLVDKSSDKTGPHYISIEGFSRRGWNAKKRQWNQEVFKITKIEEHD